MDKIVLDIDLSFPRQYVTTFSEFSKIELVTNRMFDFKNIEYAEDSLGHRTISSNKYQAFSRKTTYLFDIN